MKITAIASILYIIVLTTGCGDSSSTSSTSGQGGSMARFNLVGDFLYTIANSDLQLFNISSPATPSPHAIISVDFGIETLFVFEDKLFIGDTDAVHIYDASNASNPSWISTLSHATSCDPVVANNSYAYITLSSGSICSPTGTDVLEVIDISDIASPTIVKNFAMQNPKGLGLDDANKRLYICDGIAGLKVYDTTDPVELDLISVESEINCYDLIVKDQTIIVSAENAIVQYNTEHVPLTKLSEIKIETDES